MQKEEIAFRKGFSNELKRDWPYAGNKTGNYFENCHEAAMEDYEGSGPSDLLRRRFLPIIDQSSFQPLIPSLANHERRIGLCRDH